MIERLDANGLVQCNVLLALPGTNGVKGILSRRRSRNSSSDAGAKDVIVSGATRPPRPVAV